MRFSLLCVVFVVGFCVLTEAKNPHERDPLPGIATDQPSEGPFVKCDQGYMVPYTVTLPGTQVTFRMIPVPGAEVPLPGPEGAQQAHDAKIRLEPFWIGQHEVTWAEYKIFMGLGTQFGEMQSLRRMLELKEDKAVQTLADYPELTAALQASPSPEDGVTAPTALYDPDTTYQSGEEPNLPAVSMTHFAAQQYCKWLSSISGAQFRLPSEAEWEYAARAGGDPPTPENLDDFAWHTDNSDYTAHPVGEKSPNAWGLHDMLGNVAELVLDEASPLAATAGQRLDWQSGVVWPRTKDPRIVKGGHWDAPIEEVTIHGRLLTDEVEWKLEDPNIPKSPWWYADMPSAGVGMRIVRPLKPMSAEVQKLVWDADTDEIRGDVAARLREGRGKLGPINVDLPKALEQLRDPKVQRLLQ